MAIRLVPDWVGENAHYRRQELKRRRKQLDTWRPRPVAPVARSLQPTTQRSLALAIKSLVLPILTGGAIAMGALVLSNARRVVMVRARAGARRPRIESDPIGLGDDDEVTPERVTPVKVRTEAEATAAVGAGWPLPSLGSVAPPSERSEGLAPRSMSEPLLDFDVDFEDVEFSAVSARDGETQTGMAEQYDAVDPDSLAAQWLVRATETGSNSEPLDDVAELPTEPNPLISEASIRAAEFSEPMAPADVESDFNRDMDEGEAEAEEALDSSLWDSTRAPEDSYKK